MKNFLRFLIFLFAFISGNAFAQDSIQKSNHSLVIQRYAKGKPYTKTEPVYIFPGEKIRVRTLGDHHPQEGILTQIRDSSLTIDSTITIRFSDIKEIGWYSVKVKKQHGKGMLITGGTMFLVGAGLTTIAFTSKDEGLVGLGILVGLPVFITGVIVSVAAISDGGKGSWHNKQISQHWRINASPVSARLEKASKEKRRKNRGTDYLPTSKLQ